MPILKKEKRPLQVVYNYPGSCLEL
jgi:hypothetical protein